MVLSDEVIRFLSKQGVVIVSTIDEHGRIHCSAKGIVGVVPEGVVFVIDLYLHKTFQNLENNSTVSITVLDEKNFKGYTLQGKATVVRREDIAEHIIEEWERRIIDRISRRVISGVQAESQKFKHTEASLPAHPKYLIEIDVENVIDLSPIRVSIDA
ncbi:MAG: pyridoxamine 5'-phosphate oxidase family protein [Candidatus Omnitrophica bacterium]|nr:pyridoxamine 5'-phosphate oxidase family protein [Candidatus Omnitrophota bacterium]